MQFKEFINRNKNVAQASVARRISSAIQVTEERNAFYNGELFKKYDLVESDGKQYRIIEQCSNYYQVVNESGEVSRKFAKQLNKLPFTDIQIENNQFHGYKIVTEEAQKYFAKTFFVEAIDNDDVGILKTIKELDESMSNQYQNKDKLTVAKIIADTLGVKHDAISSPDNLVNQAIAKAKKDSVLMKNKELIANMIEIAREVGIKVSDKTFTVTEETKFKAGDKIKSIYGTHHTVAVHDHTGQVTMTDGKVFHPTKVKLAESLDEGLDSQQIEIKAKELAKGGPITRGHRAAARRHLRHLVGDRNIKESEDLDESDVVRPGPNGKTMISAEKLLSKAREFAIADGGKQKNGKVLVTPEHKAKARAHILSQNESTHNEHTSKHKPHKSVDCSEILKYLTSAYREITQDVDNGISADGKHTIQMMYNSWRYDLMNDDFAEFEKSYDRWAAKHVDAFDYFVDIVFEKAKLGHHGTYEQFLKVCESVENNAEPLEELSIPTLKTYSQLAKKDASKLVASAGKTKNIDNAHAKLDKAGKRLDGAKLADKKAFAKDWKHRTGQNEDVSFSTFLNAE
jgi:hypothetical protein